MNNKAEQGLHLIEDKCISEESHIVDDNKEAFHNKHELFTETAYNNPGLLPDRYVFILTNLCNLKCGFCFQKKEVRKDSMNVDDWISLSSQIPDYARITLCGGEPLVFPGFRKVFVYVAERFDCNIITNGILLKEDLIDFILSFPRFKVLSLSIDNIGNTIRGLNKNQWDSLVRMIKYFVRKRNEINSRCMLDIKTMILDENAEILFDTYRYFVEELGTDTHAFQFLKGSPIQHADHMYEFDDMLKQTRANEYKKFDTIKKQLGLVRNYNLQSGRVSFLHPKMESLSSNDGFSKVDLLNNPTHDRNAFQPCKFPWSSVHINFDGHLFPCLAVSMGNVKEATLMEINNGEEFARFRDIIKRMGTVEGCNRCGWLRPR